MTRPTRPAGRLHGAGRWLTATITTGAALAALLVNARNLGVNQMLGLAEYSARRIWVTPRADTLAALGDTTALAASVTDKAGVALIGVPLLWRSSDTAVVTVDSAGSVEARGPGTARVTVAVRDLKAEAMITVRQHPASVEIPGDTVVRLLEGDTVPFVAYALDGRGHRIREMVPRWRSADSAVVAVDSLGLALALAPGWTVLTAETGDQASRIAVRVDLAPAAISLISGGHQRVPAGRAEPQPVVVRVLSRGGMPVPGAAVAFTPADGEGLVGPATAIADRDGRARTTWTLGPRPGRQRLVTSVAMLDTTLVVVAEADPVPRNTKVEPVGEALTGRVDEALGTPATVHVTDSTGAALADVPVVWRAVDGGGVEPLDARTDSVGEARARWTLGPRAGWQRLHVQVGNPRTIAPLTVTARASAAEPATLTVLSGGNQSGPAGTALPKSVVIVVRDAHGNGVPAVPLTVAAAQGSVADSAPLTDSTGRATLRWTLGRSAELQGLAVRTAGLDTTLRVSARARAGAAANVAFQDPPAKGKAGVAIRLVAVVTDAYGNHVPNALVVFGARAGTLSASRVKTDDSGLAAMRWTPARAAGAQTITATLSGTAVKATYTMQVAAPAKAR
jgi:protocatechuate 3,4-dioxygenase beta subunit